MSSPVPRRRPSLPTAALALGLGVVLLVSGPGTRAWWSDEASIAGTTVTSGTLDLVAGGDADDDVTWSGLSLADVAPGESLAAELTVDNAGSVPFTWTVHGTASGSLAPAVTVEVFVDATASVGSATYPRSASCQGGTSTYSGVLGASPVQVVAEQAALGAAETATLCVRLQLGVATPDSLQGLAITPAFTVSAAQETP